LVTLSACDTARGKTVRGDGMQALNTAFLGAGAAATVTSLWKVEDESTAAFMQQFYYFLDQGLTKAAALRSAKLQFLHSRSGLENPRSWAAFVLTGDGWNTMPQVVSWTKIIFAVAALVAVAAAVAWGIARVARPAQQMAETSKVSGPQ